MNPELLRSLFDSLSDDDWCAVVDGACLVVVDDQRLALAGPDADAAIVEPGGHDQPDELRSDCLARVNELLADYYRANPLSRAGFTTQAHALIDEHGPENFAGTFGPPPPRTLFVDGGKVIAPGGDDPRHRYGAFCELDEPLPDDERARRVRDWVEKGEAYVVYVSMNACRYGC